MLKLNFHFQLYQGRLKEMFKMLHLSNNIHALYNFAKNDVFAIEPVCGGGGDEELASVGVGSGVGHGQNARLGVLQLEVLVLESRSVDGLSTSAVVVGEVTSLAHEVGDHPVECAAFVSVPLLAGAQSTEILRGFRHYIASQLKFKHTIFQFSYYYTKF